MYRLAEAKGRTPEAGPRRGACNDGSVTPRSAQRNTFRRARTSELRNVTDRVADCAFPGLKHQDEAADYALDKPDPAAVRSFPPGLPRIPASATRLVVGDGLQHIF